VQPEGCQGDAKGVAIFMCTWQKPYISTGKPLLFFRKNVGFCITLHLQTSQCTPWKLAAGTMFNVKAAKVEAITRRGGQSIKNGQATITVNTNTSHVGHVHSMRVCFLRTFVQPMII
jgi:hypothetical protein